VLPDRCGTKYETPGKGFIFFAFLPFKQHNPLLLEKNRGFVDGLNGQRSYPSLPVVDVWCS
jgi:hypothetical protein